MRPRDNQRQRVYDSEHTAAYRLGMTSSGRTIPNDQLQAWVDAVLDRRPIRSRWGAIHIEAVLKRGGSAYGGLGRITLPLFARNEWIVLHEIAHSLTERSARDVSGCPYDVAWHGPEYVGVYLFLVKTVLGEEAYKTFLAVCRENKVRRNNTAIPPVLSTVPPPRAERIKARKREAKEKAQKQIKSWLYQGTLTKADLRRLAA